MHGGESRDDGKIVSAPNLSRQRNIRARAMHSLNIARRICRDAELLLQRKQQCSFNPYRVTNTVSALTSSPTLG
jgi:hypothetical protein